MAGKLFYQDDAVTLYLGDAAEVVQSLPAASVHCIVTSPPFWQLRNYGTARWIGGRANCQHEIQPSASGSTDTAPVVTTPWSTHRPTHRTEQGLDDQPGPRIGVCTRCGARREDRQCGLEPTLDAYIQRLRTLFSQLRRVLVNDGTVWLNLGDRTAPSRALLGACPTVCG